MIYLTGDAHGEFEPTEVFLSMIDQNTVDKSTGIWLDEIEDKLEYDKWYCGHYHTAKKLINFRFYLRISP